MLLEFAYKYFVYAIYEYAGFVYDFNLDKYIIGWLIYFSVYFILIQKKHLKIYSILQIIFLFYILPHTVLYALANKESYYYFIILFSYILVVISILDFKKIKLYKIKYSKIIILIFSFILTSLVILNLIISTGGNYVLNFTDVYEFRDDFDEVSKSGIFGYLNLWVSKVFSVLLLAWSIIKKNKFLIILFSSFIIIQFLLTGHKSILQSIFVLLFFYYFFKFKNRNLMLLTSFAGFISVLIIFYYLTDNLFIQSLLIRRLIFVPANLNYVYFDFFSSNDHVYWSSSFLSSFIQYGYDLKPAQLIGSYLGTFENANTGFIPNGFMHAGLLGVFLYTLIMIFILNYINFISKGLNNFLVYSIVFLPIFGAFISSDLTTSLLSHGLFISIVILRMYSDKSFLLKLNDLKFRL